MGWRGWHWTVLKYKSHITLYTSTLECARVSFNHFRTLLSSNSSFLRERNDMLEVLFGVGGGGSNCSLAQLMREWIYWQWGSIRLMMCWSRSDCTAKAQSKNHWSTVQITRSATQGFCWTNTSRSALSLARRQVGQQLWKEFKTHALYVALVSSLHYSHYSHSLPGHLQAPGQWWVSRLRVPIFPARISPRKSITWFFQAYTDEQHAHQCLVSRKKGARQRRRQASDKKKKKKRQNNKQKQSKDKINPFKTVKTQFNHQQQKSSCQHYITWLSQTELPTVEGGEVHRKEQKASRNRSSV